MTWWIRAYLVFAAIQGLGIGLTGLVAPSEMQIPLRLSPLNARFVASLYAAGGVGVLWAAVRARKKTEARLFVVAFGVATGLILIVTLLHWPDFMSDPLPHRPVWIFVYVADPLLALIIVPLAGLYPSLAPLPARLATVRRGETLLLRAEALIFGVVGLALLLAPDTMAALWPWNLQPVVAAQVYGCFFLTFALGALFAASEVEPRAVAAFILSSLTLGVLVLVVSTIHLDRFKPEPVTWLWFGAFGVATLAFAAALLSTRPRRAVAAGAATRLPVTATTATAAAKPPLVGRIVRGFCLVVGAGLLAEGVVLLALQLLGLYAGDVRHNALHAAWGVVILALVISDRSQRRATHTALVFGVFYTALAFAGVLTAQPFGLQLGPGENAFHFIVGPLALALGVWSSVSLRRLSAT